MAALRRRCSSQLNNRNTNSAAQRGGFRGQKMTKDAGRDYQSQRNAKNGSNNSHMKKSNPQPKGTGATSTINQSLNNT
jgi:hypothetical protein